jgi:hypothetical protein
MATHSLSPNLPPHILPSVPTHYATDAIGWTRRDGSVEASTLSRGGTLMSRVWNDACDLGFILVSHRTLRAVLFILDKKMEKDGEVVGWLFTSHSRGRNEAKFTLTVFND